MLVGLAGYAGSGKDTAASCLIKRGWRHDAFAKPLKEMALEIDPVIRDSGRERPLHLSLGLLVDELGWEKAKLIPSVRRYLQNLGSAVRKHLGEDVWIEAMRERCKYKDFCDVETFVQDLENLIVTDVRYPNEAKFIRNPLGGAYVFETHRLIWISRPGVGPINEHESDQGLVRPLCTHELINDGTPEQLWAKVLEVVGEQ